MRLCREGRYNMKFRARRISSPCRNLDLRGFWTEAGKPPIYQPSNSGMLGPLVLDQFFILAINTLTTSMVGASGRTLCRQPAWSTRLRSGDGLFGLPFRPVALW